jgi:hypothetical protein
MREFFYVDLQRVRSYYAQANRGIIESIVTKEAKAITGDVKASLFGIGAGGSLTHTDSRDETRSLQELTYILFEELLDEHSMIADLDDFATDPESWGTGAFHDSIHAGQILRFTGDVTVLDPDFFDSRVSQMIKMITAIAGTQIGDVQPQPAIPPTGKGGAKKPGTRAKTAEEVREARKRELVNSYLAGMPVEQIEEFKSFFTSFSHNSISLRVFPCGSNRPEFHFSGSLLSRTGYMQAEREELYGRYGNTLTNWTTVMQVARIPHRITPSVDLGEIPQLMTNDQIDRVATERYVNSFIQFFEDLGVAEGAKFPSISVTPLALYREF